MDLPSVYQPRWRLNAEVLVKLRVGRRRSRHGEHLAARFEEARLPSRERP